MFPLLRPLVALGVGLVLSASALAADVQIPGPEGISLAASEFGSGEKGVILVHGLGKSRADWGPFAERLAGKGFHVVSLDLRGHGASTGTLPVEDLDMPKLEQDVAAATAWLRTHGAKSIALVGAELGANVAANVAGADPNVGNLVLLSAGMTVKGLRVGPALEAYGKRPLLAVASSEESYDAKSLTFIETKATGEKQIVALTGAGRGTKMLTRDPGLETQIVAWLNGTYNLTTAGAGPQKSLETGTTTGITATGTEFGSQR